MKLSYQWLKEYVNINVSAEELAKELTMSGSEVEAIEEVGGDKVMSLEITSNRPDCLNIIGLAREASAVFDTDLHLPSMEIPAKEARAKEPRVECIIKNNDLCPCYTARVITGVQVQEASDRIKKHILAVSLRPVNNVVDVTNFCLMEMGQPLHAFDLDKIEGDKIIIRGAVKSEKIVTIDGEERELRPGMLVIADSKRPIAIAGIMGGKDTEVTGSTKTILLESAYFNPISIRQTARALGLASDSSYRFERGVDKGMIARASDRSASIIAEETGGKICEFYDAGKSDIEKKVIEFDIEKAGKMLGERLEKKQVERIFQRLGMTVSGRGSKNLSVGIPTFREDLKNQVDLVEEVARIYGYHNVPATMTKFIPQVKRKEHPRKVLEKLYETLSAAGLNEIMTYSLISEATSTRFSSIAKDTVSLKNPLSEEQKILTPQLLDGMLRAISWNINRKNKDLGFFEIGKIYSRARGKEFSEVPALSIGLSGTLRSNWQEGERGANFYDLKGILEKTLKVLRLSADFSRMQIDFLASCAGVKLEGDGQHIGFLGEVSTKLLNEYDIDQPVYICQIKLDEILEKSVLTNRYHAVARFPSSSRDISILCDKALASAEIRKTILESGEEIIRQVKLLDVYEGEQIPPDKRSLSYGIDYGLDTRTLTDEEVEAVHSKIKEALIKQFKVGFR